MIQRRHPGRASAARAAADRAAREEDTLGERWESAQTALRERFDEPIERATEITRRTLGWFPVRVWRHFLQHNGFLLAASISYQSLFSIFAVTYGIFAAAGFWVGGSESAISALINLVNRLVPGLIGQNGLMTPEAVEAVAGSSGGVLAVTGGVAGVVAIWTAIGFVTFTRRAVRDIFGLDFDRRSYILLKARDFVAAAMFGVALVLGAVLGWIAGGALNLLLSWWGLHPGSAWSQALLRLLSVIVAFAINSAALAGLYRLLAGATLPWRTILSGSLLGGAATAVLQVAVGLLLAYTPSNPLLATFSVLIGFLLWFRLVGIVILVAASWIAVAADDREIPLQQPSAAERRIAQHAAVRTAAEVRLRTARRARSAARWWQVPAADRRVREAEEELERVRREAPVPVPGASLLP